MIYKIFFIVGLVYIIRFIMKSLSRIDQLEEKVKKQSPASKPEDTVVDAEYTVVDKDK